MLGWLRIVQNRLINNYSHITIWDRPFNLKVGVMVFGVLGFLRKQISVSKNIRKVLYAESTDPYR